MKFQDKVVLVTGSSRGIGRATAIAFAEEGADVAVNYTKDKKSADEVVEKIKRLGRKSVAIEADVANESDVQMMIKEIVDHFGNIDILVNNAGIVFYIPIF